MPAVMGITIDVSTEPHAACACDIILVYSVAYDDGTVVRDERPIRLGPYGGSVTLTPEAWAPRAL